MDIASYVGNVRRQMVAAAETGGEDIRALAESLTAALESAIRLTLLEALSAAADEITRALAPGSVDLRLRGNDPSFVVMLPPAYEFFEDDTASGEGNTNGTAPSEAEARQLAPPSGDEGATSRINFRPPEQLKLRIEQAARGEQLSVNAWLVRAVTSVLESGGHSRPAQRRAPRGSQRYTGWVH